VQASLISIVDDDDSFRQATASLLRSFGHEVTGFASAEEFLKSSALDHTTCLISDVQMPGMSGIELQNRLISEGHDVPIIFVTAYPESHVRERALASGAFGFLSKPFNAENLISCLTQVLSGSKP
jgi:FixJ family two-component response regulator